MRSLNSRAFFLRWQNLYASSNPGHLKERWEVGGVEWNRDRHSYFGATYSVQFDVHRLEHRSGGQIDWLLLVVTEHWWGPDRATAIRNSYWCRAVIGSSDRILKWFDGQTVFELPRTAQAVGTHNR